MGVPIGVVNTNPEPGHFSASSRGSSSCRSWCVMSTVRTGPGNGIASWSAFGVPVSAEHHYAAPTHCIPPRMKHLL
jgi:hypothetical protein